MIIWSKIIIICGGGLVGSFVIFSLLLSLGSEYYIVQVGGINVWYEDYLYGGVIDLGFYNFLFWFGFDELMFMLWSVILFLFGIYF